MSWDLASIPKNIRHHIQTPRIIFKQSNFDILKPILDPYLSFFNGNVFTYSNMKDLCDYFYLTSCGFQSDISKYWLPELRIKIWLVNFPWRKYIPFIIINMNDC